MPPPVDDLRTSRVDMAPGAVGQLPHRRLGPVQGRRHLGEAQPEHVVQHERRPLQRRQRLEHDEHGHRHRVGHLDALGGTTVGRHRFGEPRPDVVLPPVLLLTDPVQRLPGRDGEEVGARVADLAAPGRDGRPAQPRLLYRVLRVGDAARAPGMRHRPAAVAAPRTPGPARLARRRTQTCGRPQVALLLEPLAGEAQRRVGPAVEVLQGDRRGELDDRRLAEVLQQPGHHLVGHAHRRGRHRLGVLDHPALEVGVGVAGAASSVIASSLAAVHALGVRDPVAEVEAPAAAHGGRGRQGGQMLERRVHGVPVLRPTFWNRIVEVSTLRLWAMPGPAP